MKFQSQISKRLFNFNFVLVKSKRQFQEIKDQEYSPNAFFIQNKESKFIENKGKYFSASDGPKNQKIIKQVITPRWGVIQSCKSRLKMNKNQQIGGYIRLKQINNVPKQQDYEMTNEDIICLEYIQHNNNLSNLKQFFNQSHFIQIIKYLQMISYKKKTINFILSQKQKHYLYQKLKLNLTLDEQLFQKILIDIFNNWKRKRQIGGLQPLINMYYPRYIWQGKNYPNTCLRFLSRNTRHNRQIKGLAMSIFYKQTQQIKIKNLIQQQKQLCKMTKQHTLKKDQINQKSDQLSDIMQNLGYKYLKFQSTKQQTKQKFQIIKGIKNISSYIIKIKIENILKQLNQIPYSFKLKHLKKVSLLFSQFEQIFRIKQLILSSACENNNRCRLIHQNISKQQKQQKFQNQNSSRFLSDEKFKSPQKKHQKYKKTFYSKSLQNKFPKFKKHHINSSSFEVKNYNKNDMFQNDQQTIYYESDEQERNQLLFQINQNKKKFHQLQIQEVVTKKTRGRPKLKIKDQNKKNKFAQNLNKRMNFVDYNNFRQQNGKKRMFQREQCLSMIKNTIRKKVKLS